MALSQLVNAVSAPPSVIRVGGGATAVSHLLYRVLHQVCSLIDCRRRLVMKQGVDVIVSGRCPLLKRLRMTTCGLFNVDVQIWIMLARQRLRVQPVQPGNVHVLPRDLQDALLIEDARPSRCSSRCGVRMQHSSIRADQADWDASCV